MNKKHGSKTITFENPPRILSYAAVGSKFEGDGPLGKYFDRIFPDPSLNEDTWEKAESKLQKTALSLALRKGKFESSDLDFLFAGDLLNQCTGSTFGVMGFNTPFVGVYGACSTMALSLIMASVFIDGKMGERVAAVTSSHFCSAEKQYRFPLEYGNQRPQNAQWTATASGALIIGKGESNIKITKAIVGKIMDKGIKDTNNMGAAMAPAAADTIMQFLKDTNSSPEDYDAIYTGDLGVVGSELLYELTKKEFPTLSSVHKDCGLLLYDRNKQDVHSGGSGCGCSASVLCTHILNSFKEKTLRRALFCATGALLSPTSAMQGENIPSIAHLIEIVNE